MFNPGLIDMIMALRSRGISDNAVLGVMLMSRSICRLPAGRRSLRQ